MHDDLLSLIINHTNELSVQNSMCMLRLCMVPKLMYLLRTVRPSAMRTIVDAFDAAVIKAAYTILQLHDITNSDMKARVDAQLHASLRTGGFGLTRMST